MEKQRKLEFLKEILVFMRSAIDRVVIPDFDALSIRKEIEIMTNFSGALEAGRQTPTRGAKPQTVAHVLYSTVR